MMPVFAFGTCHLLKGCWWTLGPFTRRCKEGGNLPGGESYLSQPTELLQVPLKTTGELLASAGHFSQVVLGFAAMFHKGQQFPFLALEEQLDSMQQLWRETVILQQFWATQWGFRAEWKESAAWSKMCWSQCEPSQPHSAELQESFVFAQMLV